MTENIFDNYNETQKEVYWMEIRKTRQKLLTIAIVLFLSDVLGLLIADMLTFQFLLWSLLVPTIIASLAFLALKEPMAAMVIATLIILALWVYLVILAGGQGIFRGFLVKIIVIYLIIAGFQSAREAHRMKKEIIQ